MIWIAIILVIVVLIVLYNIFKPRRPRITSGDVYENLSRSNSFYANRYKEYSKLKIK